MPACATPGQPSIATAILSLPQTISTSAPNDYMISFSLDNEDAVTRPAGGPVSVAIYKLHGVSWSPDGPMALHAKLLFDPILQAFHLDVTEAQAPCLCSDFEYSSLQPLPADYTLAVVRVSDDNMIRLLLLNSLRRGTHREAERDVPAK